MAQISYLKRRGAVYYARMPVPLDLQELAGTTERARSLGTRDPKEAKRKLTPIVAGWQAEFEELRRRRDIAPGDVSHAVWNHYTSELAHDDIERVVGPSPVPKQWRQVQAKTLREHLGSGETALIEWAADDLIERNGWLVQRGSLEYRDLCLKLQRAQIEALNRVMERDLGDFTGTPKDPIVTPPLPGQAQTAAPGESVIELFDQYAKENPKAVKPDTLNQSRLSVQLFVDLVGKSFPARRIDKKAVREWKAILLDLPVKAAEINVFAGMSLPEIVKANKIHKKPVIKTKTINRHLAGLGAFCDWLQRNEYIDANPVIGLYQAIDRKARSTLPFTVDQMNTLFASPLFTGCLNDTDWHKPGNHQIRDYRYWVPLVMLYSGARPAEIAQLLVEDVRQLHGQWVIHITTIGDDEKSVKTKGSMRVVPVHPELVKLGFIKFREAMAAKGETRLFPEATRSERGQMIAEYSRAFPRYLTRLGIKEGRGLSLYSFRHGFIDALRRAEYLDDQFGFLVGHKSYTTTEGYGTLPQGMLRQRVEMVEKVSYPGLKLSHLMPAS